MPSACASPASSTAWRSTSAPSRASPRPASAPRPAARTSGRRVGGRERGLADELAEHAGLPEPPQACGREGHRPVSLGGLERLHRGILVAERLEARDHAVRGTPRGGTGRRRWPPRSRARGRGCPTVRTARSPRSSIRATRVWNVSHSWCRSVNHSLRPSARGRRWPRCSRPGSGAPLRRDGPPPGGRRRRVGSMPRRRCGWSPRDSCEALEGQAAQCEADVRAARWSSSPPRSPASFRAASRASSVGLKGNAAETTRIRS